MTLRILILAAWSLVLFAPPAMAAETDVPYWASIRVDEVNMRVGPGEDYRIAWVYRRPMLPVKVLRVKEGWRLVADPDGTRGWMLGRFLSRQRSAIVTPGEPTDIREQADGASRLNWRAAPGVVGALGSCTAGWCQFAVGKRSGYVDEARLWGSGEP